MKTIILMFFCQTIFAGQISIFREILESQFKSRNISYSINSKTVVGEFSTYPGNLLMTGSQDNFYFLLHEKSDNYQFEIGPMNLLNGKNIPSDKEALYLQKAAQYLYYFMLQQNINSFEVRCNNRSIILSFSKEIDRSEINQLFVGIERLIVFTLNKPSYTDRIDLVKRRLKHFNIY